MNGFFDIDVLRRRLRTIMDARDVKPTTLSLMIGKNPSLIVDLFEKNSDVKLSTIFKMASALQVSVEDLLKDEIDAIPVGPVIHLKGEVAAGQWAEAFEWPRDEWQEMYGSPDVSADRRHRFFLKVRGDSMNQIYPEGTLIECVSIFGNVEALPGKRVVVLRRRFDQMVEATVKEMVVSEGGIWLAPRSSNPAHQAFKMDAPGDDIEEVIIVAVVVASIRRE